jgi:hypothetical protein
MPVVVVGAPEPQHVLDDDVVAADADLAVTARAPVQLLGDATDQPGLVAFGGQAQQRLACVGQVVEHGGSPLSTLDELIAASGEERAEPL